MYGTIARVRLKPGAEERLTKLVDSYAQLKIPGHIDTRVYRMDADSSDYYMVVAFEDKGSYVKNASNPDQDTRYRQMVELLQGDPEWHDGDIIFGGS